MTTLNLDEILGTKKTLKIIFGGKEYFMLSPEAMGPRQMAALSNFNKNMNFDMNSDEISDEEAKRIEEMVNRALEIFCPELKGVEIPFTGKIQIINFYMDESGLTVKTDEAKNTSGN